MGTLYVVAHNHQVDYELMRIPGNVQYRGFSMDSLRTVNDSLKLKANSLSVAKDSLANDTAAADTVKKSKSALDLPVTYSASDSITFEQGNSRANLFGNGVVKYQNLELQAELITMSLDSSLVHAMGRTDSTGAVKGQPLFKQGSDEYEPEKISYNFKTQKAFINNVYTKQGDGFLISEESKRDHEGVMYVRHGKYTTCDATHPHFYLALTALEEH